MRKKISNYNLAIQSNFKLEIPGHTDLNYFLQTVTLPSVSLQGSETPYTNNQTIMPGNYIDWSSLNVTVLMDEDFSCYFTLHNWMTSFIDEDVWRNLTKDIKLHIVSANKKSLFLFTFTHAFPVNLSDIQMDNSVLDAQQMTFNAEFRYQYFTFEKTAI